ncbi:hypothetical protein NUACC21_56940 [Scytonema sp. NUACC21]
MNDYSVFIVTVLLKNGEIMTKKHINILYPLEGTQSISIPPSKGIRTQSKDIKMGKYS